MLQRVRSNTTRPYGHSLMNLRSPHAAGLYMWWPFVAGGITVYDRSIKRILPATLKNSPSWRTSHLGRGLACTSGGMGAELVVPLLSQLTWPMSITAWFTPLGTPDASAGYFGITNNSTDSNPYLVFAIATDGTSYKAYFNYAGTFAQTGIGSNITTGAPVHIALTHSGEALRCYTNGVETGNWVSSFPNPSYDVNPLFFVGNYTGVVRNSNAIYYDCRLYNRTLSAAEVAHQYAAQTRWDLYRSPVVPLIPSVAAAGRFGKSDFFSPMTGF